MTKPNKVFMISLIVMISLSFSITLSAKPFEISPVLKSAILPGWGQLSIDNSYGYAMLTGEVLFWSAYFYSTTEQNLKDQQSYEYALKFAHVNPGKYSEQYYRDLTKFDSSGYSAGGYNANVRQTAIDLYPYDLVLQQDYIDENAIPDEMAWQWDTYQQRKKYSSLRKDILELKDQAQVITGIIIANHIISSIDMLRLRKHWKNVNPSIRYYRKTPILNFDIQF